MFNDTTDPNSLPYKKLIKTISICYDKAVAISLMLQEFMANGVIENNGKDYAPEIEILISLVDMNTELVETAVDFYLKSSATTDLSINVECNLYCKAVGNFNTCITAYNFRFATKIELAKIPAV
jgi:hypothetical protein